LDLVASTLKYALDNGTKEESVSLKKFVKTIVNTYKSSFGIWNVGFGLEHQIN
jgi:hypothetical protein